MEVSAEAKRIMVVALGKLYSSRTQRGGLRLQRSLLLTLVMKSARDIYHAAQATAESVEPGCEQRSAGEATAGPAGACPEALQETTGQHRTLPPREEAGPPAGAEDKENLCPAGQHSRKRRGKATAEPDFLPCKKAKLEQAPCPQQLSVTAVLMDYVNCHSDLAAPPAPVPLQRAIAAC